MRCSYTTPNGFSQVLKASELEPFFLWQAKRTLVGHHPTSEICTIQLTTDDGAAPAPWLSAAISYLTLPGLTG